MCRFAAWIVSEDVLVNIVKGEAHAYAGEFYQVAGQVVELPPEIALAAVDFNRSVLAADKDILL